MLEISPETFDVLTRDHLFRRVRAVLRELSLDGAVVNLSASTSTCDAIWAPHYQAMKGLSEHDSAVRLAYLLVAHARGLEPELAAQPGAAAVTAMKVELEDMGVLPFAAFD